MKSFFTILWTIILSVSGIHVVGATPKIIEDVPAYEWYHGCGPTAAAMILGYYDLNGYDNLFDASGWEEIRHTESVKAHISSSEHNEKYNSTPDNESVSNPPDTSIADFFETSQGALNYGSSYLSKADDAFIGYADYRGYAFDAWSVYYTDFGWEDYISEIDNDRPMMLLVDSDNNGQTDHFVAAIGYDDRGDDGLWYGVYNTWNEEEEIDWYRFLLMDGSGQEGGGAELRDGDKDWGIAYATYVHPLCAPVIDDAVATPEPGTALLLGCGLIGMAVFSRKKRAFRPSRQRGHRNTGVFI